MAILSIVSGNSQGRIFTLKPGESRIGRTGCDIVIDDDRMSRYHARILHKADGYEIEDLNSRNGTFLNNAKIAWGKLTDGDRIRIGDTEIVFYIAPPAAGETLDEAPSSSEAGIMLDATRDAILIAEVDEKDYAALQRAKADLAAVYRAGQVISSILNPDELYPKILDIIIQELPMADCCSIHLVTEGATGVELKAGLSRDPKDTLKQPPFSRTLLQTVLRESKSVLTFDAQGDQRFNTTESIQALNIRSAMCVPLPSRNRLVGIIQADTIHPEHRFSRDDLKLLTAFGALAGPAIENAQLYEKLTAEKAELEQANAQLKLTQEKLVLSEKLAAMGKLTAGIVHDIKNPMTVILSHADLLEMVMKKAGVSSVGGLNAIDSLKEIQKGVMHCNEILNGLLQFAGQSRSVKAPVNINDLLRSTESFMAYEFKKANTALTLDLGANLPVITADANQLKQTFINIMLNALQAMGRDGTLKITTSSAAEDGKTWVTVTFADNGPGMSEEVRKKVFDPFFTTKKGSGSPGGTGLGLSVSYGIIQNHGGTIEVASAPGQGATFTIRLPAQPPETS